MSHLDPNNLPAIAGKHKLEKASPSSRLLRHQETKLLFKYSLWGTLFLTLFFFYLALYPPSFISELKINSIPNSNTTNWETQVKKSSQPKINGGLRILVTGAAGFVGSHVSIALRNRGDGVLGLDNFNHYYDPELKRARQALLLKSNVFIVEGDINDDVLLQKLFNLISVTHIIHLAAQAGVRYAMENPKSYIDSNIAGFVNLLEVSKSANPQPAIIWASSSSVYGLNSKTPFSENDRTDNPASLYAATKKAGEEIAHTYNHIYGLSMTGLRFFTVYGPWGRPDMAYFFFTKAMLKGDAINVFKSHGKGKSVARDFTYIDDIVKGCLGALDTAGESTGSGGKKKGSAQLRIFNLGNTSPVPVTKLVSLLEKLLKVKAKKKVMVLPGNGDVEFTHANISLAESELGYRPGTDLEMGLKKFVKWYLGFYGDLKEEKKKSGSTLES